MPGPADECRAGRHVRHTCISRMLLVLPAAWNGMPAVITDDVAFLGEALLTRVVRGLGRHLLVGIDVVRVWTLCAPQSRHSRREVSRLGVRARIAEAGRLRATRAAVVPHARGVGDDRGRVHRFGEIRRCGGHRVGRRLLLAGLGGRDDRVVELVSLHGADDPVHHRHRLDRVAARWPTPPRASPRPPRRRSRWRHPRLRLGWAPER